MVFLGCSVGKESTCNAGGPGSIPGLGRSPGAGVGYPLQYSWASLVAQLVKNLFAMQETRVRSLGWEDPLEKKVVTHSSVLAWRIPWTVWGLKKFLLRSLSLACRWPSSPCVLTGLACMCVCVLIFSSYKDTSHVGLGSTPGTSF